jgi:hypothetical protein
MIYVNKLSKKELEDITWNLIPNIVKYLNEFWDIKVEPKNYQEYLKTYDEFDELPEEELELLEKRFTELNIPYDVHGCHYGLPHTLAINNVAYSDKHQSRKPLEELVKAIWSHGNAMGLREAKVDNVYKEMSENYQELYEDSRNMLDKFTKENHELEVKYLASLKRIRDLSPEEDEELIDEIETLQLKIDSRVEAIKDISNLLNSLKD